MCLKLRKKGWKGNCNIKTLYDADYNLFGFLVEYYLTLGTYNVVMIHKQSFLQKVAGVIMYCSENGKFMRYKIRNHQALAIKKNGISLERPGKQGLEIEEREKFLSVLLITIIRIDYGK